MPKKRSNKSKRHGTHLRFRYKIASGETVIKATNQLIAWSLQGKISSRNFGAINNAIGNILKVIIPREPTQVIQAVQTTMIPTKPDLVKFLENLPLEVKEKIAQDWKDEIVRKLNSRGTGKGEVDSVGGPAVPSETAVSADGVEQLAPQTNGSHSKNRGESTPPPT